HPLDCLTCSANGDCELQDMAGAVGLRDVRYGYQGENHVFAKSTGPRFPLLLTTGRILSQYNVGAQTRRTENSLWHKEDLLEIHPHDAEQRGIRAGDWVRLRSRAGETTLRAELTDRVAPGVVYTTFHHPDTQANVITTDYSDWATNCPEYKVTAVQVSPSNGPSRWQEDYEEFSRQSRRIAPAEAAE
ncbi:MAG: molybdopterin dinucleotide binding domain-containing protein, partial [Xanthobacteraceae bacterium]